MGFSEAGDCRSRVCLAPDPHLLTLTVPPFLPSRLAWRANYMDVLTDVAETEELARGSAHDCPLTLAWLPRPGVQG